MSFDDRLESYNDVASRIGEFREKHPDGCLRPVDAANPFSVTIVGESGRTFIVYAAAAYRTPDDPMPGIGLAWEPFPGKTPYTKDSELQNAETAAWGRAIVAVLAADARKGIASREDVRNRQADRESEHAQSEATEAQELAASDFAEEIQAATLQATIDDIGARVKRALAAGRITREHYERLGRMAVACVERMGGVRDSTGERDGGGAEPGQAGKGARPDSAGAGDGGPGRDGEAGRVRPGVQSGVHSRARVDRSAKTPGDDRDTPATVGG